MKALRPPVQAVRLIPLSRLPNVWQTYTSRWGGWAVGTLRRCCQTFGERAPFRVVFAKGSAISTPRHAILPAMALRDHAIWWPGLLTLPVLLGQAIRARRTTPLLPSAPSPHSGTSAPKDPSDARALSLYLIGESTVAGVGARTHEHALSGQLASGLAEALARPVHSSELGHASNSISWWSSSSSRGSSAHQRT